MGYYDNKEDCDARGIDYDLVACLEYNEPDSFGQDDIERVLAVIEGQNDGDAWHWLIQLKGGSFVYATGWCDYTGWDCQSDATYLEGATLDDALALCGNSTISKQLAALVKDGGHPTTWRTLKDAQFGMQELIEVLERDVEGMTTA